MAQSRLPDQSRITAVSHLMRRRSDGSGGGGVDVSMTGRVFLLPLSGVIEEYEKEEDADADAEAQQRPPIHAQHPPVGLSLKRERCGMII